MSLPEIPEILGYKMSGIEFFGTLSYFVALWLMTANKILTWPVGLIGTVLFTILFYDLRLYSDAIEQIYYLVTGIYGWWVWSRQSKPQGPGTMTSMAPSSGIGWSSRSRLLTWAAGTLIFGGILGYCVERFHLWMPQIFPEPASFPYWDAITTSASFAGNLLTVYRRMESWVYWLFVNSIGIVIYGVKGVYFVTALYGVYLVFTFVGYYRWKAKMI